MSPRKRNTIQKIGKRVVAKGGGKDVVTLSPDRLLETKSGCGPSARGPPVGAIWIDVPQLRARFGGRSFMWVERLLKRDPTFPRPTKIGRLRFFKLDGWHPISKCRRGELFASAIEELAAADDQPARSQLD